MIYDGSTPAPGTVETRRSFPCSPPLRNDSTSRSAAAYDNVINQFAVGVNPRYAHRGGSTYCNIFVWDVTSAMGAEIPHWVSPTGDPTPHLKGNELNANALNDWLNRHGARFGWRKVPLADAVAAANRGCPAVASWKKPGGIGHVAMIRPGVATASEGPWMAQAGAQELELHPDVRGLEDVSGRRAVDPRLTLIRCGARRGRPPRSRQFR